MAWLTGRGTRDTYVEDFERCPVDSVQTDQRRKQPPSLPRLEQIGIASSRVVK